MSHGVAKGVNLDLPIGNPSLFLTGASGSLGRAIALQHAQPGARFRLWGRDGDRLASATEAVTALGATALQTSFDLTDPQGAAEELCKQDETEKFDIAYLVAGTGETRAAGALVEDPELITRMALVNYVAPAAMASAMAARMAQRGGGRIVIIGSAAGHHSLPFAASYSSSKAGLARFADALRLAVQPHGVSVTLAAPGFINTPAARAQSQNRPFEIEVEEAARRIVRAGARGAAHYVTPWPFRALHAVDALLPNALRDRILAKLEA